MKPLNKYHRKVCDWLDEYDIGYREEYPVGPYSVDIWIPKSNLGVEIDGPQHSAAKDMIRDAAIERETGMRIVRIPVGMKKDKALAKIFIKSPFT